MAEASAPAGVGGGGGGGTNDGITHPLQNQWVLWFDNRENNLPARAPTPSRQPCLVLSWLFDRASQHTEFHGITAVAHMIPPCLSLTRFHAPASAQL